ncbi:unnamed protein product [Prorocentrum cordatum]|uniref:Uncharacterized protein n=1 Tax=Prorocentrum cordatum TaxID=2364126 RepID=A0ABN9S1V5_9DINO|nr:unnamed protein product [Polarella glacialis]
MSSACLSLYFSDTAWEATLQVLGPPVTFSASSTWVSSRLCSVGRTKGFSRRRRGCDLMADESCAAADYGNSGVCLGAPHHTSDLCALDSWRGGLFPEERPAPVWKVQGHERGGVQVACGVRGRNDGNACVRGGSCRRVLRAVLQAGGDKRGHHQGERLKQLCTPMFAVNGDHDWMEPAAKGEIPHCVFHTLSDSGHQLEGQRIHIHGIPPMPSSSSFSWRVMKELTPRSP